MTRKTIIALVTCILISIIKGVAIDDYQCLFKILSNDHTAGPIGQYFNFDVSTVNCILGSPFTTGSTFSVFYSGDSSIRQVIMWNAANTGSIGDGAGRLTSNFAANDWQVGEWIAFVNEDASCTCNNEVTIDDFECSFEILSNDHSGTGSWHQQIGAYFNFDVATADCSLGSEFTTGIYNVFYSGTNSFRNVALWRNANTGSVGDGAGRKQSGAAWADFANIQVAAGDWAVGEQIAFLGTPGCSCDDPCQYSLEEYVDICYCADDDGTSAAKSTFVRKFTPDTIDYPNEPDWTSGFRGYTFSFSLSFTDGQFMVFCVLNTLFILICTGLCLFVIKTTKQLKEYQAVKKVDYLSN